MQILDISNPLFPSRVGYYDTYPGTGGEDGNWGVYPYLASGHILASDMQTGLYVLGFNPNFGTLDGTVRDAATADPLPGVTVEVPAAGRTVTTDDAGYYRTNLDPGGYDVSYSLFGYATDHENVTINQGGTTTTDVSLSPLPKGSLAGFVNAAPGGAPLQGATVEVLGTPLATTSGADGSYSFPDVPAGSYRLNASLFGFGRRGADAPVWEGQETRTDFGLRPSFFADNAETNLGWTLGAAGDNASTGVWVRADPVGTGGGAAQPEDDHTPAPGIQCFVTGNCNPGCGIGDNDVDGGKTTFSSPIVNASGLVRPVLAYWRWYTNNAGNAPNSDTWEVAISNDGGTSWVTLESTTETRAFWDRKEFVIGDYVTPTNSMRVRFIASDLGDGSIVEAAVDDVEIYELPDPAAVSGSPGDGATALLAVEPNPFRGGTLLRFRTGARGPVALDILDVGGRIVRRLLEGNFEAGAHAVPWDGRDDAGRRAADGIYFERLRSGGRSESRKLIRIE